MGYYFKFESKKLKLNLPKDISGFIWSEMNQVFKDNFNVPNHKLFSLDRWHSIFCDHGKDYESNFQRTLDNKTQFLKVGGEINYGYEEIYAFFNFISPYVLGRKHKEYLGYYQGEDQKARTNVYLIREYDENTKRESRRIA